MTCTHHYIHDGKRPIRRTCDLPNVGGNGKPGKTHRADRLYQTFICCKCGDTKKYPTQLESHEIKNHIDSKYSEARLTANEYVAAKMRGHGRRKPLEI